MSTATQCPECATRFKVSQEQLDAHQGMVRCGRCQAVFNAREHLQDEAPSPQLDLPIMQDELPPADEETTPETFEAVAEQAESETSTEEPHIPAFILGQPDEDEAELPAETPKKRLLWPWALGSTVLLLLLLAQGAYFFRVELAARMPGLKPALTGYCQLFGCHVPLPHNADLMSIESSNLEADPDHPNVIVLTATLRNISPHSPYTQAYPNLELTLNDINDQPVGRRVFRPAEYLPHGQDEQAGLGVNREVSIHLSLDTGDLKPAGYRLLLFYPK